jgi:NADPH-dependent glutamate synthase beta subunit-like oxidoreductase/2,4-dienoyl-CoA reductase-like NADH-dependent reductase (Old Yellow Enzyme family)
MISRDVHAPFCFESLDELRSAIAELKLDLSINEDISCLSKPIRIGKKTIPNSIAVQPMEGCDGTSEGAPSDLTRRRYRRFAAGGAGVIWVEATAVVEEGRANPRQLWINERTKDSFAYMLDEARKAASESMGKDHVPLFVCQLTHSGRYSRPGKKTAPIIAFHDPYLDPTRDISPSDPVVSDDYLKALEEKFVEAARLAFEAGFDAVDVKACHRYLVNELLAAHTRCGQYGGSYENRVRFLKNVIARIFEEMDFDKIVTCRLNIFDAHPYPYGWGVSEEDPMQPDLAEPKRLIHELYDMGVAMVNITMGNPYYKPHINRPYDRPIEGALVPNEHPLVSVERLVRLTRQVREGLLELIVVGSGYSWLRHLWPYIAAAEVERGNIQIVGLGRQALAYPDFAKEIIQTGKLERRHTCITCSSCTQIMRDGGSAGCVPFDSEIYGPVYREGRRNSFEYIRALASRCRDCFDPRCRDGCPAGVNIPGFIRALSDGDIEKAYRIIAEKNPLPGICGYVCPADMQCQGHCIENIFSQNPVPIAELQVYVSKVARDSGWTRLSPNAPTIGKRIAVLGAGPAGLACTARLIQKGYVVHLYDISGTLGGLPVLAIPDRRLNTSECESEIKALFSDVLGDRLVFHGKEGLTAEYTLDQFVKAYNAVFLSMGLGASYPLTEPQPDGVVDAVTFLKRCKAGDRYIVPRVAVLGGGNTAVDAAVEAVLCGAQDVYLVYRRSFAEMPAWPMVRNEAQNLGVQFLLLTQPLGYEVGTDGKLRGLWITRTRLGEPDESGRRRPILTHDRENLLEVDMVIEALGQRLPLGIEHLLPGIEFTDDRLIKVDEHCRTSRPGVYAGGDVVRGGATVVQAVADGVCAAEAIASDLA